MSVPEFVDVAEQSRTYHYADGGSVTFESVRSVGVSNSGTHRLNLQDGRKIIVVPGWRWIEFSADKWSF